MGMASQEQTYSSKQEMLDVLAEELTVPSRFAPVSYGQGDGRATSWVGGAPLKHKGRVSYGGKDYTDDEGAVIRLNLPEQLYLNSRLSKRLGFDLRLGSLKEQLAAAWSKEFPKYRNNVLKYYRVFTGQVLVKKGDSYDVRKAEKAEFVRQDKPRSETDLMVEMAGVPRQETGMEYVVPKLSLGPIIQSNLDVGSGYYPSFKDEIPEKKELGNQKKKSKGWFDRVYSDNQGCSAVWSFWDPYHRVLFAGADRPLDRSSYGALGAWADENPKK